MKPRLSLAGLNSLRSAIALGSGAMAAGISSVERAFPGGNGLVDRTLLATLWLFVAITAVPWIGGRRTSKRAVGVTVGALAWTLYLSTAAAYSTWCVASHPAWLARAAAAAAPTPTQPSACPSVVADAGEVTPQPPRVEPERTPSPRVEPEHKPTPRVEPERTPTPLPAAAPLPSATPLPVAATLPPVPAPLPTAPPIVEPDDYRASGHHHHHHGHDFEPEAEPSRRASQVQPPSPEAEPSRRAPQVQPPSPVAEPSHHAPQVQPPSPQAAPSRRAPQVQPPSPVAEPARRAPTLN